jgi:hypothetical protein
MALDFIFMLTRHDRTVDGALSHVPAALDAGVRHIGFKDIGLPVAALAELNAAIRGSGAKSYLEVVSLDEASEAASAAVAVEIGVDYLLGGTHVDTVLPIIAGHPIRYYPFPGRVRGHPSVLEGSIEEIAASAGELAQRDGVDGLDLLAYRSALDARSLMKAVCEAAGIKPVIVAGSIDDPARIAAASEAGAAGFTIGTAVLEGRFPASGTALAVQLGAIMRVLAEIVPDTERGGASESAGGSRGPPAARTNLTRPG